MAAWHFAADSFWIVRWNVLSARSISSGGCCPQVVDTAIWAHEHGYGSVMLQSGELRNEKRMAYLTGVCCEERREGSSAWCVLYQTTPLSLTLFFEWRVVVS
jgi:hypothetical protein